jgi:hypothetical protein
MARFFKGGSVDLYHNGNEKLATTSTGIDVTGTVVADGLTLGDNEKAKFGAGGDLQIYHSGTTSYIRDTGDGDLQIFGSDDVYIRGTSTNNFMARFNENAAVDLYFDNSKKLATTSTGVDVTGTVTADGLVVEGEVAGQGASIEVHATTNEFGDALLIAKSDNASTGLHAGVKIQGSNNPFYMYQTNGSYTNKLRFNYNSMSDAGGQMTIDNNGDISFYEDTGTTPKFFWDASAESLGIGNSAPLGALDIRKDGASQQLQIWRSDLGVNDRNLNLTSPASDSATEPFNFQTGNAIAFSIDATEALRIDSNANVGIGTSSPAAPLHVQGSSAAAFNIDSLYRASGDDTNNYEIQTVYNQSGASSRSFPNQSVGLSFDVNGGFGASGGFVIETANGSAGPLILGTAGTERMRIDSSGKVGIGTSSPATALDVTGTITADALTVANSGNGDVYVSRNSGASVHLQAQSAIGKIGTSSNHNLGIMTNGSTRLTVGSSGNVGIGTTSPLQKLDVRVNADTQLRLGFTTDTSTYDIGRRGSDGLLRFYANQTTFNGYVFDTANGERMKIDSSGNVLVGTTSTAPYAFTSGGGVVFKPNDASSIARSGANAALILNKSDTDGDALAFRKSGTAVGSISVTGSATAYNTSSDYRLKTNVQPMTGATATFKQLKPVNFEWIADGTRVDGFLAHELQEVIPAAATGSKDAMQDEEYEVTPAVYEDVITPEVDAVDATFDVEGVELTPAVEAVPESTESVLVTEAVMATRSVPDMQGIDQSKIVPLLTATIQELIARIEALEA